MTIELLEILDIVDDDVTAVVNTYLAKPKCGLVMFGQGYRIDPVKAVADHHFANRLNQQSWASLELRRAAVRAAIMLAQPEQVESGEGSSWNPKK